MSDRTRSDTKRPKTKRRRLYNLHTWVGFHLAFLMAVVLLTGTVATVAHEIDWLVQDDMRVSPAAAEVPGETVSWGEMERALRAHRPDDTLQSLFKVGGDHFAYRARMVDEFGRQMFVHVDPWTGDVTGETHPLTVQRFFRDLHRYLFMPNFIGLPLVTSLAFILMISLYTGLKTARNWRTLLFRVRTDKGARIMIGDAHKAAGLWSIWFFIIVIVTSVWYLAEFGAAASGNSMSPPGASIDDPAVAAYGATIDMPDLDRAVAAAISAYPELTPTVIQFPFGPNGTIQVQGNIGNPLIRPRANQVFLHPETLEVIKVRRSSEIGAVSFLNEMADPLHFGNFGGLPTKLIWFLFGVFMTGLSLSGVWLTWQRLKSSAPSNAQFATLPVLLLSFFFFTQWYGRWMGPERPVSEVEIAMPQTSQGISAQLYLSALNTDEPVLRVALNAQRGFINARRVTLTVNDADHDLRLSSFGETASARLPVSADSMSDDVRIELTLDGPMFERPYWLWKLEGGA